MVKLKTAVRSDITAIIVKTLAVITRTFEIINSAVIIMEVARTLIIIIVYVCASKLTFEINVIVIRYIIVTIITIIMKRE